MRRLLQSVLNRHNFDVYACPDGRETLNQARELLPDLIVLDVNMPILDGFEVLRLLRSDVCTRKIKVIFLTAATEASAVQTGSSLGADDYLGKPFNHLTFVRKIKSLLLY
jgi:DNA-binding response OmpR family regulator